MRLRRLNEAGMRHLQEFLDSLTTDEPQEYPEWVLTDDSTSEPVGAEVDVERVIFNCRYDAAEYLHRKLADSEIPDLEREKGIWAWLSLFYFDQLCPADTDGKRKPHENARWIPAIGNFRKYYRHLLAGPYRIYHTHRDAPARALSLLCTPVHRPGDIVEQLLSRQELVTNPAVMEAATALYVNHSDRSPKRGASGRGPGSARRLAQVLDQFAVTWDLHSMEHEDLLTMLPREFDRFRH